MESLESLLRDELREAPVFDDVSVTDLLKATEIGRRLRIVRHGVVGVVVAALLIGVGVTLANRPRSAGPPTLSPPVHVLDPMITKAWAYGLPIEGTFLDARHGWVLINRCVEIFTPDPDNPSGLCTDYLEVTTDGGVTFTEHALPTTIEPQIFHLHVYVFDPTHLVLAQALGSELVMASPPASPSPVPGELDRARWTSSDGGATWTAASVAPGAPVAEIPAGAQVIAYGTGDQPTAVLTPDGVSHVLTSASALATPADEYHDLAVGPVDGAYYLYDGPLNTAPSGVQVSHDLGRTWQRSDVPAGDMGFTVVGSDGHWTYATAVIGFRPPWHLYASTDGIDWRPIPPSDPDTDLGNGFAALPSVGLLVGDGTDIWRTDGTKALTPVLDRMRTTNLIGCGPVAVALRITTDGVINIATTTDGVHWTDGTMH